MVAEAVIARMPPPRQTQWKQLRSTISCDGHQIRPERLRRLNGRMTDRCDECQIRSARQCTGCGTKACVQTRKGCERIQEQCRGCGKGSGEKKRDHGRVQADRNQEKKQEGVEEVRESTKKRERWKRHQYAQTRRSVHRRGNGCKKRTGQSRLLKDQERKQSSRRE